MSAIESAAVLNGRYHVLRPVGRGGMGAVYEAVDLRLRNTVAVKEMTASGEDARQAFEREARLLAALRHAALPVVIDYFIEGSCCCLVMQYIEGEDLAAVLRRKGPCSEADVQRWGGAVLHALVYLHGLESPVIHRDIKPANIKLTPRGDVVLLDFGLAKGHPSTETRPAGGDASLYGFTPNYAPPEQVNIQGTDGRSDLYALGATLYHLLTGVAPPAAADRGTLIARGESDPLGRATTAVTIGEPFAAFIRRAMALDPRARFQSAAEMLSGLTALAPGAATEPIRPNFLLADRAPKPPSARTRRVDAAAPSRAEVNRLVDLLVQVRFADSPLLGLEDWPTRRRPDRIEQTSETVKVDHPVDTAGRVLPARLRVKLVAPDFDISGAAEQTIDVPPEEYSQRVAFLMTPRRTGYCRVNVEVYAVDTLYLGSLAIEPEVLADRIVAPPLCTSDLTLNVRLADADVDAREAARQAALHAFMEERERREGEERARVEERERESNRQEAEWKRREAEMRAERERAVARREAERHAWAEAEERRQQEEQRHLAEARERADRLDAEARARAEARERESKQKEAARQAEEEARAKHAAKSAEAQRQADEPPTMMGVPPAPLAPRPTATAEGIEVGAPPLAGRSAGAGLPARVAPAPSTDLPPQMPARSSSTIRSIAIALSAAAVLLIAVQVWNQGADSTGRVAPTPAPTDTVAAAPEATAGAPPAQAATPTPTPAAPAAPPAAAGRPPLANAKQPGLPARPSPAGKPSASRVDIQLVAVERVQSGVIRVRVRIANNSSAAVNAAVDLQRTRLSDQQGASYPVIPRADGANSTAMVAPGRSVEQSFEFAVPDRVTGSLVLAVARLTPSGARFPTVSIVIPRR